MPKTIGFKFVTAAAAVTAVAVATIGVVTIAAPAAVAAGALETTPVSASSGWERTSTELAGAIGDWNDAFAGAFARRDADAIAALFTEDAVIIDPLRPLVRGRDNIAEYFDYFFEVGFDKISTRTNEVFGDDETAVEVGTACAYFQGSAVAESRYMAIFKRAGDRWLLHRILSNQ
jgi:uncharacterized protein (TIGR02246 family)